MANYLKVAAAGDDLAVARLQEKGIPPRAVDAVAELFGIPKGRVLDVADISASTYGRHIRQRKPLSRDASESLVRLLHLHWLAKGTLAHPAKWFLDDHPMLGGRSPLDTARTEAGGRAVERLLHRIEFGSVA